MKFKVKLKLIWISFLINSKRSSAQILQKRLDKRFDSVELDSLHKYKKDLLVLNERKSILLGGKN